jgi:hypothetical protein
VGAAWLVTTARVSAEAQRLAREEHIVVLGACELIAWRGGISARVR